eukprot:scaffold37026_cov36-Cyclotella_meneghiniana.AAC.3
MAAMVSTLCRLLSRGWGSQVIMKPPLSPPELDYMVRLELNGCNGLNMQTFESWVGLASQYEAPTFNTRIGCVWTLATVSLQLDCSIVSL